MDQKKAQFLPFHAINEFMRDDYQMEVVRRTLQSLDDLPGSLRQPIDRLTRQKVHVPGFRNADKAPAGVRLRPTAEAFEKSPELAAAILSAWAAVRADLASRVYDFLVSQGWEILPVDADRSRLPGFLTRWPLGKSFEQLYKAYIEAYPDCKDNQDDVSLMIVWLSGRLPFETEETVEA